MWPHPSKQAIVSNAVFVNRYALHCCWYTALLSNSHDTWSYISTTLLRFLQPEGTRDSTPTSPSAAASGAAKASTATRSGATASGRSSLSHQAREALLRKGVVADALQRGDATLLYVLPSFARGWACVAASF